MSTSAEEAESNEARAQVFEAISHPSRIRILQALEVRPMGFADLGRSVGIEGGGHLAFHLRKLARLVKVHPEGFYSLTDEGREALRSVKSARKSRGGKRNSAGSPGARRRRISNILGAAFSYQRLIGRRLTVVVLLALLLLGGVSTPKAVGQTQFDSVFGSLSVDNTILLANATSAQLPSGSQTYLWAFDTGGYYNSADLSVGAKDNYYTGYALGGEVGESGANQVNFSTATRVHSLGGAGVSGFANETFHSAKANPQVYSVEITVTPTSPSLAVIIALQSGDRSHDLAGNLTFGGSTDFVTDQANYIGGPGQPIVIAHAFLMPGTYQFTSSVKNTTSDASYASMIAVWLFTPASPTNSTAPTLGGLPYWEFSTITVLVVVAIVAVAVVLRRARRPGLN